MVPKTIARAAPRLVRACEACGRSAEHEVAHVKWGFPIFRCLRCGLGSIDAPPGNDAIYAESYFQGGRRDGYANYAGSEAVLRREFAQSVALLRRHHDDGRLLELGCAYGFFLLEAQPYYECVGVEVAEAAVAACRARGLAVYHGVLDRALAERLGTFDAAVMLDVIEHLEHPRDVLEQLGAVLRPGGVLVLTTGDWNSAAARLLGRHWRLLTPPQHVFYFTPATLTTLLERAGFEVLEIAYPPKIVPLSLIVYQLFSRLGLRPPSGGALSEVGVPVTLFDAMRVVARRSAR
jgi:SAM-dependent methyltransferase